jgi:RHS repeat-associated protein
MRKVLFILALLPVAVFAQTNTIKGVATPSATTTYEYAITTSSMTTNPVWEVTGIGSVHNPLTINNYNSKCLIKWNASGAATITFKNGSTVIATKTITVACAPPVPSVIATAYAYVKGKVTLQASLPAEYNGSYNVRWYSASSGGTLLATGLQYTTPEITASTNYYAAAFDPATNCESARVLVTAYIYVYSINHSIAEVVRVKGVKTEQDLQALTGADKKITAITCFDGLMRPMQQITMKATTDGKAMVLPIEYDATGRTSKQFLPYADAMQYGEYQSQYSVEQAAFYANTTDKVADDAKPYAVTEYEKSPSGRVEKQGTVGDGFQPHQHTAQFSYGFNDASEVRQFNSDGSSSGFHAANTLYKTTVTDADSSTSIQYTSNEGHVVLTKRALNETINDSLVSYLETYYIYNTFGQLVYMISPKGVASLKASNWATSAFQSMKANEVYQFVYDHKGRTVSKKVPGQGWVHYVFDKLNRLVLMQDTMLSAQNKWLFMKYDMIGRTVMQGLYQNTTQTTRAAMQTLVDGQYVSPTAPWYEEKGTALHGYTNNTFPGTNLEVLSVNYYDNHDFDNNGTNDYTYTDAFTLASDGVDDNTPGRTWGKATGSKQLVLGTSNTWLVNYIFYDDLGRAIQVRSNNHMNPAGIDNLATSTYLWDGTRVASKTYHNAGSGKQTTVLNKYAYYDNGLLKEVRQKNNSDAEQLVAQYIYNDLGQLVDKKLHGTGTPGSEIFLQSVDYRYTIRGQLSSINNSQLTINDKNDDTNDHFGIELLYHTAESGLNNLPKYDGNISAVKWKGVDGSGATDQKSYKYGYDKSGKLKTATSQMYNGSAWTKESGVHNESMTYDHNGNIKNLQRNQRKHQINGVTASYTSESVDNLTYTYNSSSGEQLRQVEDASTVIGGFSNGTTQSTEYTYDVNGNLTADKNKGIDSIRYNEFGKVVRTKYSDGRVTTYTYDAGGNKLTMKNYASGGALQTTTEYVGGFVYENGTLKFFSSPEGRVVKNGTSLEYEYAIADHQGNTRVVFTSAAQTPSAPTATFEGDANDNASQYCNVNNVVSFIAANNTPGGSKVVRMNQSYKTGPAKSLKVYPGDAVAMEVWTYYESAAGYGTTNTSLTTMITSIAGAFGGVSGGAGESGAIYNGVNGALGAFGMGANNGDTQPAAYLNYIQFDKNYKVLDAGWERVPASASFAKQKITIPTKNIKEAGYMFVYLSYENQSNNYVYFDDFKITHTKSNVIQYNEYYPFGLQTSTSWTRDNSKNDFLYNAGSELNASSGWYETMFRGYDPAIGRFLQVDPLAHVEHTMSPYQYAGNNPIFYNDPRGLLKQSEFDAIVNNLLSSSYGGNWSQDAGVHHYDSHGAGLDAGIAYLNTFGGGGPDGGAWAHTVERSEAATRATYAYHELAYQLANASIVQTVAKLEAGPYNKIQQINDAFNALFEMDWLMAVAQQGRVVMDLNGNILESNAGANDIFVATGSGLLPFHDRLVKNGTMNPDAFSKGLLNIVDGMDLPGGHKFDSKKLYNGQLSLALHGGISTNGGVLFRGMSAHTDVLPGGIYKITYTHLNGENGNLTVNSIRTILGVHEYYAHGILGLRHPSDNAAITNIVSQYTYTNGF